MDEPTQSEPEPLIPPIGAISPADRMFRVNWVAHLDRSPSGVPLHEVEYVARQGRGVRLVDVRDGEELTGPLGYIPGSLWIPRDRGGSLRERLDPLTPVILISRGGERASVLAHELEKAGMRLVAALRGGMIAWRALGFASTRDPEILRRRDQLPALTAESSREPGPLSLEEIEAHVGDPRSTRWVKLAAILLHGRQACVDGRDDSSVVGTPGGDAQVQVNLQTLIYAKEFAFDPQQALEAPRWTHFQPGTGSYYPHVDVDQLVIESRLAPEVLDELSARGHNLTVVGPLEGSCAASMILRDASGLLSAGADPRRDGWSAAF